MSTTKLPSSILERIGDTSLVELNRMVPEGGARILLKMEAENPSGSMKDRMALAMVEAAERDGRLGDGGHVIEYTGGSTGVSLALVAAVKGHALAIVTSDAFSLEKRDHMAALGAELTIVPSIEGGMSAALTREMVETARRITARTGGFWANQLENADQLPAYHQMGEEIWRQTEGRIDAFVQSAGTAASVRGTSEALHRRNPAIHCLAVEPAESAVLSGGPTGVHRIEGIGAGFVVPLWDPQAVDDVAAVSSDEAMRTARRLAVQEGIFAGTSTGANLAAAIRLGSRLGPRATIVTVMCDTGLKYLSTALYAGDAPSRASVITSSARSG